MTGTGAGFGLGGAVTTGDGVNASAGTEVVVTEGRALEVGGGFGGAGDWVTLLDEEVSLPFREV